MAVIDKGDEVLDCALCIRMLRVNIAEQNQKPTIESHSRVQHDFVRFILVIDVVCCSAVEANDLGCLFYEKQTWSYVGFDPNNRYANYTSRR